MNALLKKLITLSAVATAVVVFSIASPAYAQRDAGAKARGEVGTGFWSSRPMARSYSPGFVETRRSFSYQPRVDAQRSYSYEPAPMASTGCATAMTAQGQAETRRFSYEPAAPAPAQPRYSQPSPRVRNPIERKLRPGRGFWE